MPEGFVHALLTLNDTAEFLYKTTNYCAANHERCIVWNDLVIGTACPRELTPQPLDKDQTGSALAEAEVFA
jgi:dTDP-4-dehydrorhamnose 3,5-epimerase